MSPGPMLALLQAGLALAQCSGIPGDTCDAGDGVELLQLKSYASAPRADLDGAGHLHTAPPASWLEVEGSSSKRRRRRRGKAKPSTSSSKSSKARRRRRSSKAAITKLTAELKDMEKMVSKTSKKVDDLEERVREREKSEEDEEEDEEKDDEEEDDEEDDEAEEEEEKEDPRPPRYDVRRRRRDSAPPPAPVPDADADASELRDFASAQDFAQLAQTGASRLSADASWAPFTVAAVAHQRSAAKMERPDLPDSFWAWLDTRPDVLLSLAASNVPVVGQTWTNMERLWREFKSEIQNGIQEPGEAGKTDIASFLVGQAHKNSIKEPNQDRYPKQRGGNVDSASAIVDGRWEGLADNGMAGTDDWKIMTKEIGPLKQCGSAVWSRRDPQPTVIEGVRYQIEKAQAEPVDQEEIRKQAEGTKKTPAGRVGSYLSLPWMISSLAVSYFAPKAECEWVRREHLSGKPPPYFFFRTWDRAKACQRAENPFHMKRSAKDGRICGGQMIFRIAERNCRGGTAAQVLQPVHAAVFYIDRVPEGMPELGRPGNLNVGIWNSITGTREKNDVTWTLDLKERAYPEYLQNKGTVHYVHAKQIAHMLSGPDQRAQQAKVDMMRLAGGIANVELGKGNAQAATLLAQAIQRNPADYELWNAAMEHSKAGRLTASAFPPFHDDSLRRNMLYDLEKAGIVSAKASLLRTNASVFSGKSKVRAGGGQHSICPAESAEAAARAVLAAVDLERNLPSDELTCRWRGFLQLVPSDAADADAVLQAHAALRVLVEELPVAHADGYSEPRWLRNGKLVERCVFREVAAVAASFQNVSRSAGLADLQPAVDAARAALERPWEFPRRVAGPRAAEILVWARAKAALKGTNASADLAPLDQNAPDYMDQVRARELLDAQQHCPDLDGFIEDGLSDKTVEDSEDDSASMLQEAGSASNKLMLDGLKTGSPGATNKFIRNAPGVGGWGGSCTCPDGQVYQVGDENNACRSIACDGGTPGTCNRKRGPWALNKVICASLEDVRRHQQAQSEIVQSWLASPGALRLLEFLQGVTARDIRPGYWDGKLWGSPDTNQFSPTGGGGWGGACTCPDGQVYQVGDQNNACGSIACIGGTPGVCNKRRGPWSGGKVNCAVTNIFDLTAAAAPEDAHREG